VSDDSTVKNAQQYRFYNICVNKARDDMDIINILPSGLNRFDGGWDLKRAAGSTWQEGKIWEKETTTKKNK
jgi:hypothetical protein